MTSSLLDTSRTGAWRARPRHFLMCPPTYFDVRYAINPWMHPGVAVDRDLALTQWAALVAGYQAAGHTVDLLEPQPGLPDMVFAANGATVVDGTVLQARFAARERAAEAEFHAAWHRAHPAGPAGRVGVAAPVAVNEAEGDFAVLADRVLAGYGYRTAVHAHAELARLTGREVVSLQLVSPFFYHLDTCLTVLDDRTGHLAWYPPAFSAESQQTLRRLYPDAIEADDADAGCLGLNGVSDGLNVWLPAGATHLADTLTAAGYRVTEVDLSELLRGGGSVKCCTQEIRRYPSRPAAEPRRAPATAEASTAPATTDHDPR